MSFERAFLVEGETRGGQAAEAKKVPRVALPGASLEGRVDLQGSRSLKSREGTPKSNVRFWCAAAAAESRGLTSLIA